MNWLKEHGVTADYDGYLGLPYAVLEDCHLLMHQEAVNAEKEEKLAKRRGR